MDIHSFFSIDIDFFQENITSEEDSIALLEKLKWGNEFFKCRNCGHLHYCKGKFPGSRRCTKCKSLETIRTNTIFQNCKLPLKTSMLLMLYAYHYPNSSAIEMCEKLGVRQMTCWRIKQKVKEIVYSNKIV